MRDEAKAGDRVVLHGGTYRLAETLVLGPQNSGVAWVAAPGEKPVLSGGIPVTGWTPDTNGIWKAKLDRADKVRQLYVNGRAADMAMFGKALRTLGWRGSVVVTGKEPWALDAGKAGKGFAFKAAEFPHVAHPEEMEFQQRRTWTIQRVNVAAVEWSGTEALVVLGQPAGAIAQHLGWGCGLSPRECYFYNAYEFIDRPGEFYFDRAAKTLYYMPRAGQDGKPEDMTRADVVVPVLEKLVEIRGPDRKTHVRDLRFEGLTFAHAKWDMLKLGDSYGSVVLQSNALTTKFLNDGNWHNVMYACNDVPAGAVDVNGATGITFKNNEFRLLGSTALNLENDIQMITASGNLFYEVEGAGISVGHPQHTYIGKENGDNEGLGPYNVDNRRDKWNEAVEGLPADITLDNNLMRRVCSVWWQVSPITVYYANRIAILHNDLNDTPYNSITIGWSWAEFNGIPNPKKYSDYGRRGVNCSLNMRGLKLNNNRVINPYHKLDDTGALYFIGDFAKPAKELSKQTEYSEVIGNYVSVDKPKEGLIYTDEGSSFLRFEDNVLDGPPGLGRIMARGWYHRGHNNRNKIFVNNFITEYDWNGKGGDDRCVYKGNTIVPRKRKDPPLKVSQWPVQAQEIMGAAGLEPAHQALLTEIPAEDR